MLNAIKVDKADASAERDELEEYLASPDETDFEMDLLKYWKESEYKWPALAKMATSRAGPSYECMDPGCLFMVACRCVKRHSSSCKRHTRGVTHPWIMCVTPSVM